MQSYKVTYQTQADTISGSFLYPFMTRLIETFEDMFLIHLTNSYSSISNLDLQHIRSSCHMLYHHRPPSSFGSKLKGIGKQIHDNLSHLVSIKSHRECIYPREKRELNMFLIRHQQERVANTMHIRDNISFRQRQLMSAHLPFTEIEQLIDQVQQPLRIAIHQLQTCTLQFIGCFFQHTLQRRNNQCKWCTQFMADVREETEFHIIDFFVLRHLAFYLLKMKLLTFTFQHPVACQKKHDHQTDGIQQIGPP